MIAALLLHLAASVGLAFDVLKTDAVLTRIHEVSGRAGGAIVVAAAGSDAERMLRRLVRAHPDAPCTLERVPLMSEPEEDMVRLLSRANSDCALRVAPGGLEGEWLVSEHGSCGGEDGADVTGWLPVDGEPNRPVRRSRRSEEPARAQVALDPTRLLLLERSVPDPTTALLSSFLVGFGSGHFYARNPRAGWLYAGLEAGGLAVYGMGRLGEAQALTSEGAGAARAVSVIGLAVAIGVRLVDAGTAPAAAHLEARRQIERQIP